MEMIKIIFYLSLSIVLLSSYAVAEETDRQDLGESTKSVLTDSMNSIENTTKTTIEDSTTSVTASVEGTVEDTTSNVSDSIASTVGNAEEAINSSTKSLFDGLFGRNKE